LSVCNQMGEVILELTETRIYACNVTRNNRLFFAHYCTCLGLLHKYTLRPCFDEHIRALLNSYCAVLFMQICNADLRNVGPSPGRPWNGVLFVLVCTGSQCTFEEQHKQTAVHTNTVEKGRQVFELLVGFRWLTSV
jgi:hypothetical protein